TLSVETSKSGSSANTWSPTCLSQRVIVPSVTVSPSCGIVMSTKRLLVASAVPRAPGEGEHRLPEELAQGWVCGHRVGNVGWGGVAVDWEIPVGDELGCPGTGDVHAEHGSVSLGDDLHDALGLADDHRPGVPVEAVHRGDDVVAALTRLVLGEPRVRDL